MVSDILNVKDSFIIAFIMKHERHGVNMKKGVPVLVYEVGDRSGLSAKKILRTARCEAEARGLRKLLPRVSGVYHFHPNPLIRPPYWSRSDSAATPRRSRASWLLSFGLPGWA